MTKGKIDEKALQELVQTNRELMQTNALTQTLCLSLFEILHRARIYSLEQMVIDLPALYATAAPKIDRTILKNFQASLEAWATRKLNEFGEETLGGPHAN